MDSKAAFYSLRQVWYALSQTRRKRNKPHVVTSYFQSYIGYHYLTKTETLEVPDEPLRPMSDPTALLVNSISYHVALP